MAGIQRWVNPTQPDATIVGGRIYQTNAAGIWVPVTLEGGSEAIPEGYTIVRNASGLWVAAPSGGGGGDPGSTIGRPGDIGPFHFIVESGRKYVIGTLPSAPTDLTDVGQFKIDSTNATGITAWAHVSDAGIAGAKLRVYGNNGGGWVDTGIDISLAITGPKVAYSPINTGAIGSSTVFKAVAEGGDGSTSPKVYNFAFALTVNDPSPEPIPDPPDGGALGSIIWDLNAMSTFFEDFADGQSVTSYHDDSPSGNHGTQGTGQTAPTFKRDIFGEGRHAVRFEGSGASGNGTTHNLPTGLGSTYYVVLGNSQGEGTWDTGSNGNANAPILVGSGGENPRLSMRADGKLTVSVNASIFDLNQQMTAAAYDGAGPRLICWVIDKTGFHFYLFVDNMATSVADAPHNGGTLLSSNMIIGHRDGPSPPTSLTGDFGRVLCYDAVHDASARASVRAALQAVWGTP